MRSVGSIPTVTEVCFVSSAVEYLLGKKVTKVRLLHEAPILMVSWPS